jgi:hypothetical protein
MASQAGVKMKRTEGKVESLSREVTDNVGGVSSPKGNETLLPIGTTEGVSDALVWCRQTALFDLDKA